MVEVWHDAAVYGNSYAAHVLLLQQRQKGTSFLPFPHSRIDCDEFPCDGADAGHP